MTPEFDLTKMVEEISMQAKETQEEFIFKTIRPYCEHILQIKINKEELKQILLNGAKKQQPSEEHINMVAIKGLEMPKCCSKCPLFHYYLDTNGAIHFICKYGHVEISEDFKNKRSIFCPLIEVESEE